MQVVVTKNAVEIWHDGQVYVRLEHESSAWPSAWQIQAQITAIDHARQIIPLIGPKDPRKVFVTWDFFDEILRDPDKWAQPSWAGKTIIPGHVKRGYGLIVDGDLIPDNWLEGGSREGESYRFAIYYPEEEIV